MEGAPALAGGTFLPELLVGAGILAALSGGGSGAPSAAAAFAAVLGNVGWLAIAAGAVTMLFRPGLDATVLNFDAAVDDAAETTAVVIVISGLGPNLVSLIRSVAGGSLVLFITAVSSTILEMGMPTTVTCIILSVLLAPILTPFGIPLLASHLFILYFVVIADITLPIAVAAYAASGVAKSDAFQMDIEAFEFLLIKAIMPSAFLVTPGIVMLHRNPGDFPVGGQFRVVGVADLLDLDARPVRKASHARRSSRIYSIPLRASFTSIT